MFTKPTNTITSQYTIYKAAKRGQSWTVLTMRITMLYKYELIN